MFSDESTERPRPLERTRRHRASLVAAPPGSAGLSRAVERPGDGDHPGTLRSGTAVAEPPTAVTPYRVVISCHFDGGGAEEIEREQKKKGGDARVQRLRPSGR